MPLRTFCALIAFAAILTCDLSVVLAQRNDTPSVRVALQDGVNLTDEPGLNIGDLDDGDVDDVDDIDLDNLLDADLFELQQTDVVVPAFDEQVTTVSRQESTVGRSPAAVYVITNNMIRRSGARSIPEALRLAPGVNVSRIDSNKWAISIRGFNERFANKLLVQIDGRSVYTPLFAGVFWDVQDVLLEDVERIEIIRGPGAAVWGANAVNGIINIITKNSADTQGGFASIGAGNQRGFVSGRVGGASESGNVTWRAYGKWFERQEGLGVGFQAADDWQVGRGGFRLDWKNQHCDNLTLQADIYDGAAGTYGGRAIPVPPYQLFGAGASPITGGNALFRWSRTIDENSGWTLKAYYDRTEREQADFREDRDTVDVDFQHQFRRGDHRWIWGMGYRNTRDNIRDGFFFVEFPNKRREDDILSGFLQDQITVRQDELFITLGSKFSWNDYTNFEYQPTARLLYTPSNRESWWLAVSRAVRTPSRAEADSLVTNLPQSVPAFPSFPRLTGNPQLQSEQLLAWEAGVRAAPSDRFYWDFAAFYNHYEDVQTPVPTGFFVDPTFGVNILPLTFMNEMDVESYGFELAATYEVRDDWSIRGGYSFLRLNLDPSALAAPGSDLDGDPYNLAFVHSSWDIGCHWELDLIGRYVDNFRADKATPAYLEMDARVAWLPNDVLEVAVVGRNLLDSSHAESPVDTIAGTFAPEVRREVFFNAALRY